MRNTKAVIITNKIFSVILLLLSIVILVFFGLMTIFYITDASIAETGGTTLFVIILLFDFLGILLFIQSRKRKKLVNGFRTYVSAISNDSEGSISNIAASLGMSEELFSRDIESMINKKFFTNAYIDKDSNRIIISRSQYNEGYQVNTDYAEHNDFIFENDVDETSSDFKVKKAPEALSVKCKNCGGLNAIVSGQVRECDYCGSSIKGE